MAKETQKVGQICEAGSVPKAKTAPSVDHDWDLALERRYAALRRMQELRESAIHDGMKLLSTDEILALVAVRRGDSSQ